MIGIGAIAPNVDAYPGGELSLQSECHSVLEHLVAQTAIELVDTIVAQPPRDGRPARTAERIFGTKACPDHGRGRGFQ